jgi:hypothetical protein
MNLFKKKDTGQDTAPNAPETETKSAVPPGEEKQPFPVSKRTLGMMVIALIVLVGIWSVFSMLTGKPKSAEVASSSGREPAKPADMTTPPSAPKTEQPKILPISPPPEASKPKPAAPAPVASPIGQLPVQLPKYSGPGIPGVAFVEAAIKPIEYELHNRWWGWRVNDIINPTDNVPNYQLGVLEVTRRTAIALAENLSRTGSHEAFVPPLERAMNDFMNSPTKFWLPSAESKFKEGVEEWKNYLGMLQRREANFYVRLDNLIPLLRYYQSILGSCDENLIKDVGTMSWTKSDDILYYSKGAATAMKSVLEAVAVDFKDAIEYVKSTDNLNHAIHYLEEASHIDPLVVMENSPNSMYANHRANMAAPISHARFYLNVLIVSLTGIVN